MSKTTGNVVDPVRRHRRMGRWTPSAITSCANSTSARTATGPTPDSGPVTTPNSPTASAISSTARSRCSSATATASCPRAPTNSPRSWARRRRQLVGQLKANQLQAALRHHLGRSSPAPTSTWTRPRRSSWPKTPRRPTASTRCSTTWPRPAASWPCCSGRSSPRPPARSRAARSVRPPRPPRRHDLGRVAGRPPDRHPPTLVPPPRLR